MVGAVREGVLHIPEMVGVVTGAALHTRDGEQTYNKRVYYQRFSREV